MAITFAVGKHLYYSGSMIGDPPYTFACWYYSTSSSANEYLITAYNSTSGHFNALRSDLSGGIKYIRASSYNGGTVASSSRVNDYGQWEHGAAVFAAANSRTSYRGGTAATTNTTSVAIDAPDIIYIGDQHGAGDFNMVGPMAEVGIWNVALTTDNVVSLAKGLSPLSVRPEGIVAYWPLIGNIDPEIDVVGGAGMIWSGSPTKSAHYKMFYPRSLR